MKVVSPTVNVNAFNALLDAEVVTLTGVTEAAEIVPFGSDEAHLTAVRHNFTEGTYVEREGDWLTYRGKDFPDENDEDNRPIHHTILGGAFGRVFNLSELEVDSNSKKVLPNRWNIIGLYFDGSASATLKLGRPQDVVPHAGNTWRIWIHNDSDAADDATITIEDDNGVNICTLLHDEKIFLELTHKVDGTGEISTSIPFERRLSIHGDIAAALNGNNYVTGLTIEGNAHRAVILPRARGTGQADVLYHNAEAFEIINSGSYSNGAAISTTDLRVPDDTFKVSKPGWLRAELSIGLNSANTGYIATGHGLRLHSQGVVSPWTKEQLQTDIQRSLGTYTSRDYAVITEKEIPSDGLILLPMFNYSAVASMPIGDMRIGRYALDLTLAQRIRHTYS